VPEYLRNDEISACVHRIALTRGAPFEFVAPEESLEATRRRAGARAHRRTTIDLLRRLHPTAAVGPSEQDTGALMASGHDVILLPRLAADAAGRRTAAVHALVRTGRDGERFTYAPIIVKNHEVVEAASTRRTLGSELDRLRPAEAEYRDGVGTRSSLSMTRSGLALAHASRVLTVLGHGDARARGGVVDRQRRLWWFELADASYPRFNLAAYDRLYRERVDVLSAHDRWRAEGGPFPTAPYWHRDCAECPYALRCEKELEELDDVSLVRFTTFDQQLLLRENGVATRTALARLDPHRARRARSRALNPLEHHRPEDLLGRSLDKLDELIYRARVRVHGTYLRVVEPDEMGCPTADVEVDVDMESYEDATYLWGAFVSVAVPTAGVTPGYRAFVEWEPLGDGAEAALFGAFWRHLTEIRAACAAQGRTFAAYCFWAQAEDGAMNRAVEHPFEGGPDAADLAAFRRREPAEWIDLHEQAKRQIQTEGPLGLKQLAGAAGFRWRDANPSGEASIAWYEVAVRKDDPEAAASRARLLEYNEDDCRATKALRDWLNGPARHLPHRDDPL
jgi:predicted RecB family nuclease